jgi:hypothetical protein
MFLVLVLALTHPARAAVTEAPLAERVFKMMYVPVTGEWFPQFVVYDPAGRCIGKLGKTEDADPAQEGVDPAQSVKDFLSIRITACPLITSQEFGATAPGGEGAPGLSVVELIIVNPDFCIACRTWRDRLVEAFGDDDSVLLRVMEVGGSPAPQAAE